MASNAVTKLVGWPFGMAAIAATAEFGAANGLGIVEWGVDSTGGVAWRGLLTWVVFLFAVAVLAGGATARRAIRDVRRPRVAVLARVLSAVSAGLGAALAVPLLWLPARGLPATLSTKPAVAVAVAAAAGIAIGTVLTVAGLTSVPIGVNLATTVGWVWLIALGSAGLAYAGGVVPATPRLGVVDPPQLVPGGLGWLAPFVMIGFAGATGLLVAAVRRWLDSPRLGIALSGFAGPALVASAYLVGGLGEVAAARLQPYIASLLAVTVGLLASVAVSGSRRPTVRPPAGQVAAPAEQIAIAGRPRRLAIEAKPLPEYTKRATRPTKRASAKPVAAIAAKPHDAVADRDVRPVEPVERVLVTPEEDRHLRRSEREHIDWMQNLVNTPPDPDLVSRRRP